MKFFGRLLLSLSLIVFTGCSKDSDNESPVQQEELQITGNWKLMSYSYFGSRTDILNDNVTNSQFTGVGWEMNMNMVLSDPDNYTYSGSYYVDHIVTDSEGEETLYYGYFEKEDIGTWNRSSSSITLIIDGEPNQGTITELTETALKYKIMSSSSETAYDGTVTTITRTDTYRFARQ